MSVSLNHIRSGNVMPGIYRWQSRRKVASILAELAEAGWQGFQLDGTQITDKHSFLQACGKAMQFPAYARPNWDSFEECITDLSWLQATGWIVLYDDPDPFSVAQPTEWQTAYSILQEAVAYWQSKHIPFFVLLRAAGIAHHTIPELTE